MAQSVPDNNDVVLSHGAAMVFDLVTQLSRFEDDYLEVIRAMGWDTATAIEDQEADVNGIGSAKRPNVETLATDLPIDKGVGSFPRSVAF
jgi:hypothetical protein